MGSKLPQETPGYFRGQKTQVPPPPPPKKGNRRCELEDAESELRKSEVLRHKLEREKTQLERAHAALIETKDVLLAEANQSRILHSENNKLRREIKRLKIAEAVTCEKLSKIESEHQARVDEIGRVSDRRARFTSGVAICCTLAALALILGLASRAFTY